MRASLVAEKRALGNVGSIGAFSGLLSTGSITVGHRLSCSEACGILLLAVRGLLLVVVSLIAERGL